jgi:hypothetical protein
LIAALVAVLALVGAFFFGLFVLALVFGLGLIFWLGIRLRMWWIRHQMPETGIGMNNAPGEGEVIDAEYTVVSKRRD